MVRLATLLLLLAGTSVARAQPDAGSCGTPGGRGWVESFPASGANGVTLDSPVRVRYTPGFFDDPVVRAMAPSLFVLRRCRPDPEGRRCDIPIAGSVQVIGDTLAFRPESSLEVMTEYEGEASGGEFGPLNFHFRTGSSADRQPPVFDFNPGEEDVRSTRVSARCDAPNGGYRIDVEFEPISDEDEDGAPGDVEYLLYVTRGPTIVTGPVLKTRTRNLTPEIVVMSFVIEPREAVSPICLVVTAVDGVGNLSVTNLDGTGSPSRPHCFDPIQGNFFEPLCSVGARPTFGLGTAALGAAFAALLLRARRRRPG